MSSHATLDLSITDGVAEITLDNGELNLLDQTMMIEANTVLEIWWRPIPASGSSCCKALGQSPFLHRLSRRFINLFEDAAAASVERASVLPGSIVFARTLQAMPGRASQKSPAAPGAGGFELTLACDMRFGALGHCVFGLPEVGAGLTSGAGATINLPAIVGYGRACEIVLGSGDISAERAERYGLLNRALPIEELDAYVAEIAHRMAGFSPLSLSLAKQALRANLPDMRPAMLRESDYFARTLTEETRAALLGGLQRGAQSLEMEMMPIDEVRKMMTARH